MRAFRPAQLTRSLDRLYEAAAHSPLWPEALHELSQAAGAEGAIMHFNVFHKSAWLLHSEALDESIPTFVQDEWHIRNESLRRGVAAMNRGVPVVTEATLFTPDEYRRDPMHMEFLRPHGFAWFAALRVVRSPNANVELSLQRRLTDEPFSRRETGLLATVLPHIQRAGQLALATGAARAQGVLDAFSLLGVPALLLNQAGAVCRLNAGVEALLGQGLDVVAGRLTARQPKANESLKRLTGSLAMAGPAHEQEAVGPVRVPHASGRSLLVHGAPLVGVARDLFQSARAVVIVVDLDAGRARSELHLQLACGLTRTEAQTAVSLAAGLDLSETSARRGVSLETVRSQVKSIATKTGAHSRGAQVALLNRILLRTLDRP